MFSKEKCYESQKATELFRKNVVSNNFSKEGRYHNLVNGQKLLVRGNFCSKCSPWNLYFMLFHIVFIVHLTKFANRSPLCLCSQVENSKQKNHPWTKEKKQTSPEKNERTHFCVGKKTKHLSESHKGSLPELCCRSDQYICWLYLLCVRLFCFLWLLSPF